MDEEQVKRYRRILAAIRVVNTVESLGGRRIDGTSQEMLDTIRRAVPGVTEQEISDATTWYARVGRSARAISESARQPTSAFVRLAYMN
jgi:hypothetical protein